MKSNEIRSLDELRFVSEKRQNNITVLAQLQHQIQEQLEEANPDLKDLLALLTVQDEFIEEISKDHLRRQWAKKSKAG